MEANSLPPGQSVQPSRVPASTPMADATTPVSSYSLSQKSYPIESLEVHQEGQPLARPSYAPTSLSIPFSRRKATIVSLTITLVVIMITGLVSAFFVRRSAERPTSQLEVPTQDASIEAAIESDLPPELQGLENTLLVNGDIAASGRLRVVSGLFTNTIGSAALTGNQTITLPNASGEVCLNANNCNFATQAQLAQIQPVAGVIALNDLVGGVTVQGSLNQITVTTTDGIITLSTPQALDANANAQFGSLTLGGLGTGPLRASNGSLIVGAIDLGSSDVTGITSVANGGTGANTLTANGVLLGNGVNPITSVAAGGSGLCLVSTAGAPTFQICPGGGGVSSVNSLTGDLTLQGTANQVNVVSGGSTIMLSTPQDIAITSNVSFNTADLNGLAVGSNAGVASTTNALVVNHDITGDCSFGCSGISVTTEGTVPATWMWGVISGVNMTNGGTFNAAGLFAKSAVVSGTGGIGSNYGLYVAPQTVGTNDYGIYVEGADTYALWIDSGISRFDGNLEFEGATDNAFETTLTVADPTADNTITLPNATGTVCLTSGNCAGVGGMGDILNNGQNGPITIGTNNATSLFLETNNTNRVELQSDGDVAIDTNTLFLDATNNRVGIGTATPAAPLEVSASANNYTRINETGAGAYNIAFLTNAFGKAGTIAQGYALNIDSEEQVTVGPSATPRLVINSSQANGAAIEVNPQSATQVGAVIKGFSGQTADLLQFQNSSSVAMLMINPSGQLVFEGSTDDANELTIAVANPTADRTYTIPNSTSTTDEFCLLSLGNCFGSGTGNTLQAAYNAGNTITTTDNRNILFTLADTTTDSDFIVNIAGTGNIFEVQDAGTPIFTVADAGIITIGDVNGSAGERILGAFNDDFSGINEGTYFQNFYSNSNTYLQVRPNGTGTQSGIAFTGADTNSTGHLRYIEDTDFSLVSSDAAGSSAGVPITFVIKEASGGDSEVMRLTSTGQVGIGTASPDARLELAGNESQAAWGLNGIQLQASSATYTDTGIAGTRTNTVVNSFGRPTFASTNAVTSTFAATVYIQNSPLASGNHAVTNPYSLWVDDGDVRFDGNNLTVGDVLGGGGISMYSQDPLAIYESQPSTSYGRDGNKPWTFVVGPAGNSFEIFGGGHTSGDNVATFELGGGFHVCCDSNGARLSPSNSATTPAFTFSNDGDTGIYHDAADTISFSTATTKRFDITSAGLLPGAASTYDLGSLTLEFDELYLGDNTGLRLGLDQDATLAYDEATDDRVELTGTGASLFIEDKAGFGKQPLTTAGGGAGTETATVTSSFLAITVTDDTDTVQLSETGAKDGDILVIVNVDATSTDTVNIDDIDGQVELSADPVALDQNDSLTLIYSSDRSAWIQLATSNNL